MIGNDTILWNELRDGVRDSFDKIYYQYVNIVYNYSRKITSDEALIEDCIQELFTDLWIKRKRISPIDNIKAYLLFSIKRRIIRKLSQRKPYVDINQAIDFDIELSVEDKLIKVGANRAHLEKLKASIQKLTSRQREIIYLKFYENLSYDQISKALDVDRKAVYKLMARALKRLKQTMFYFL